MAFRTGFETLERGRPKTGDHGTRESAPGFGKGWLGKVPGKGARYSELVFVKPGLRGRVNASPVSAFFVTSVVSGDLHDGEYCTQHAPLGSGRRREKTLSPTDAYSCATDATFSQE